MGARPKLGCRCNQIRHSVDGPPVPGLTWSRSVRTFASTSLCCSNFFWYSFSACSLRSPSSAAIFARQRQHGALLEVCQWPQYYK